MLSDRFLIRSPGCLGPVSGNVPNGRSLILRCSELGLLVDTPNSQFGMAWSCDGTRRVLVVNIIQQSESLAQAVPAVNPLSSMCSFLSGGNKKKADKRAVEGVENSAGNTETTTATTMSTKPKPRCCKKNDETGAEADTDEEAEGAVKDNPEFFPVLQTTMKLAGPMPEGSLEHIKLYVNGYGEYIVGQQVLQGERKLLLAVEVAQSEAEHRNLMADLYAQDLALRKQELEFKERELASKVQLRMGP
ncbi:hypothetical protein C8F04DRAFT_1176914 [Mycena alexandri]|uniref:Uncharacterized protein n=1 Tax=Mycena alexandri TaxID=1745969 RepID=A0AAD6X9P7_9AGAR|nr:hypothetical protein C8F04DRAFT_1176914 [Mycena alexandri]